jgi:predicted GIY-YIG superfamily endonuclease
MDQNDYATSLRQDFKPEFHASVVKSLEDQLDDHKSRFDKSDIIEAGIEQATGGRLQWIDDIGRDHYDTKTDHYVEVKTRKELLFTNATNTQRTPTVKLKNSQGTNTTALKLQSDFYLLAQQNAIAVISRDRIEPYCKHQGDGDKAENISTDDLSYVFKPDDVSGAVNVDVDYKKLKREAQRELIDAVAEELDG